MLDVDFWLWYYTQGYSSHVIVKECSVWGNLSYTSGRSASPNEKYVRDKWKNYDLDLIASKLFYDDV